MQERNYKSELSNCKKNKYIRYLQQENKQLVNQLKKMKRWSSSNKRVAQNLAKAEEQIWFKEQEAYKIVNINKDLEKKLQLETKSAKVLYRKNEDLNKNVWHLKKNLEEERKRTVSWKTKFEFLEKEIYNRNEE